MARVIDNIIIALVSSTYAKLHSAMFFSKVNSNMRHVLNRQNIICNTLAKMTFITDFITDQNDTMV